MIVNEPTLQHHTPRVHLENFVDSKGFVHVLTTSNSYRTTPKKAARERNFNEYKVGGDQSNYRFEKILGRLESFAGAIYPKLKEGKDLSLTECMQWSLYMSSLFVRSRKMRERVVETTSKVFAGVVEAESVLREMQHDLLKQGRLITLSQLRDAVQSQATLMLDQPAYLHLQKFEERIVEFASLFLGAVWTVSIVEEGKLLTSDMPVCTAQIREGQVYPGYGVARENTIVFLPLSPTRLFVSGAAAYDRFTPVLKGESVDIINKCIVQFAGREIYSDHSSEETTSLAKANLNTLGFGTNAFTAPGEGGSHPTG